MHSGMLEYLWVRPPSFSIEIDNTEDVRYATGKLPILPVLASARRSTG